MKSMIHVFIPFSFMRFSKQKQYFDQSKNGSKSEEAGQSEDSQHHGDSTTTTTAAATTTTAAATPAAGATTDRGEICSAATESEPGIFMCKGYFFALEWQYDFSFSFLSFIFFLQFPFFFTMLHSLFCFINHNHELFKHYNLTISLSSL